MKKKVYSKRLLAAALSAAMAVTGVPVTAWASDVSPASEGGVIASFNFDDEANGFTGAGAKAVVNGTAAFVTSYDGAGKALSVSDTNWLSILNEDDGAVLKGLEEFTLSYDSKATNAKNGWAFYAAPDLNAQEGSGNKERYVGIMDKVSGIEVERYHNNGSRPGNNLKGSSSAEWKHVDLVVEETKTTLYIDGEKVDSKDSAYKVSDILGADGGIIQIGKANWGSGEYYEGLLDNVKIYSMARSEAEIQADAPVIVQDQDAKNTTPFASYDFRGDIADSSENGYDGTLVGSAQYETDGRGGIVFPSGTAAAGVNYVKLDDGILDQLQDAAELTVTAWVRNDVTNTNSNDRSTVFSFGSSATTQFSFSTLNWACARTTFMINDTEMGGDWNNNNNTSILGNTSGNRPSPLGEWYQIAVTMRDVTEEGGEPATRLKYYMNGTLLCSVITPSSISSLGDLTYAYIGTGNNDKFKDFQGGIRGVDFISSVLSPDQIKAKHVAEEKAYAKTDAEIVAEVEKNLTIPDADDIRGNITLPSEMEGASITWISSNPAVVSTEVKTNDDYDDIPAGVVTRGEEDVSVKMTASISKGETGPVTKEFNLTVKAKSDITEEDYKGYLFAYFTGENTANGEQIYFALSEDALNWTAMNEGEPVITSDLGEKGLRDPFIIRSPEGDKFYLIATDLKINGGNGWGAAQTAGSQSIMVWESTDMVNWSDQRMVKVALDNAGCTWAPEAYYDELTGEYIVFWASKTSDDNYGIQKVYYCKTRDFYTFTEPEVWIDLYRTTDNKPLSIIDTSVISVMENGKKVYYRFSKNEAGEDHDASGGNGKYTIIEKSDTLLGNWTEVKSLKEEAWVEGGTCFKFIGENKWCLLLDNFGGVGYYPLITNDIGSGNFTKLDASEYSFPSTMRHGTVIPLTQEEYDAVKNKWNKQVEENNEPEKEEAILSYDFEEAVQGVVKDTSGQERDGKLYGAATYVEDAEKGGKVLYLDGSADTYAAFPEAFFDGRNKMTISMDIKASTVSGNFFTFTVGKNSNKYIFLKTTDTSSRLSITKSSYGAEETAQGTTESIRNKWINMTMVVTADKIALYADGKLLGEKAATVKITDLGSNLVGYLGKSFFGADSYFQGYFDNVEVFNRAMTADEIAKRNDNEPVVKKYTLTYLAEEGGTVEGESVQVLEEGTMGTKVTAAAKDGYVFTGWSDGKTQAERTDQADKDSTFTAKFTKKEGPVIPKYTLTYEAQTGGKIMGETVQVLDEGTMGTQVTAVAEEGYEFTGWSDGNAQAERTDKADKDSTFTACFSKKAAVVPPATQITEVKLNVNKLTMGAKEKVTLKASVLPAGVSQKITWSTSKNSVVKVSKSGKITAVKAGKAKITAMAENGKQATCTVTVRKAPKKIALNAKTKTLRKGKTFKIKVKFPSKSYSYKLTYKSSKKSVAAVSSKGVITAKKKGTATITVKTFNNKTAKVKIYVK